MSRPSPPIHPVDALLDIAEQIAEATSREVDREKFEGLRDYLDETYPEPIPNRGRKREPEGQSALPRFNRYAIPAKVDPKAVDCPYCVKRPRNLREHCRAVHPDKPEAR